jgi:DNA polymerase-3 subunit gamma/tau
MQDRAGAVDAGRDAPWNEVIEQLGVTGMARMLAQHCELVKRDAKAIELKLPRAHERLLEKSYQERLKAALQKRYGRDVQVAISVGEGTGNSPAEISDRERQRSHARAIAEIEQDPFVRDLVENCDARVNESSIKPIQ